MKSTLWKLRLALILAALLLVAGGAVAMAAFGGTASSDPRTATSGAAVNDQEPTEGADQDSTHTPGTEPTKTGQKEREGTITSLDCAQGSLTLKQEEEDGGTFTALLTSATVYTVNGKAGACADLKVGMQVSIEATQNGTTWTALKVSQGENDQDEDGDEQGGQTTPTPGAGGD